MNGHVDDEKKEGLNGVLTNGNNAPAPGEKEESSYTEVAAAPSETSPAVNGAPANGIGDDEGVKQSVEPSDDVDGHIAQQRHANPSEIPAHDGSPLESIDSQDEISATQIPVPVAYPPLSDGDGGDADEKKARNQDKGQGAQVAGIRFAPLDVPLTRRMQTLAVLVHCLMMATLLSIFCFLCAVPFLTWPFIILYLSATLFSTVATDGKLRRRWEFFRRLHFWTLFAGYFPAALHKTHDLPPTRKYIFGYHPHGIISHGAWAAFATEALGFSDKFPGITNSLLTLESNFRLPFYREYILWVGLQSVSKESIHNILTKGGPNDEGMGRAVTIVIGGARESLSAQPGTLDLVLRERKGFIRVAVRTGADLVPVLAFGENDLYDQLRPEDHPRVHRFQMVVLKALKFTLPFLHGRGIFNYDVGLMPYRRPLNVVVGRPIKVHQARGASSVDPDEVDRLHDEYIAELQRLWDTYKDQFAKNRKSEMQFMA